MNADERRAEYARGLTAEADRFHVLLTPTTPTPDPELQETAP